MNTIDHPSTLPCVVKVLANPYPHTIPESEFRLLVVMVAHRLRDQIYADHNGLEAGQFSHLKRPSLGVCLMNPTLPRHTPPEDAVLALIAIGPEGEDYLVNGVGKAVEHWETGQDCGISAYVQLHRLPDGSFIFGHSAEVDGTIAGASAASEQQDRSMAARVAAEFNSLVGDTIRRWQAANPENKWRCNVDKPRALFTEIAALLHS